jgi:hypothetical protein
MPTQRYTIELNGAGQISQPEVMLENETPVAMVSTDFQNWSGETTLHVTGLLDYQMKCHGLSGTGWTFKITNEDSNKEVLSIEGVTGEKFPNMSRRSGSTNP